MSHPIELSTDAEQDLDLQYRWYFVEAGFEIAEQYLDAFEATTTRLVKYPDVGRLRNFSDERLKNLRSFSLISPFQSHLIFYRFHDDKIFVERIMHGARDLQKRLLQSSEN